MIPLVSGTLASGTLNRSGRSGNVRDPETSCRPVNELGVFKISYGILLGKVS